MRQTLIAGANTSFSTSIVAIRQRHDRAGRRLVAHELVASRRGWRIGHALLAPG